MKRLWWIFMMVFVLGFGTGTVLDIRMRGSEGELPVFSQDTAPSSEGEPMPTAAEISDQADKLQYTSLEVQDLVAYDGPYPEDGSEEAVENVAALILCNTGTIGIEYAQIVATQDGRELVFDATYIPPRGTVLILESSKTAYSDSPVEQFRCRTVIPGSFDWQEDNVSVESVGLGALAVTNLKDEPFSCVRIYYKQHDGGSDTYIGGITYSAVVTDLQPGEKRIIYPYHYAAGYAGIVAVTVEP